MGDEGAGAASAADADVSAVGTLVWVRRPNGSWWPGRVVSPHEVPADCPPPTTRGAPATPILLLGRRDGPAFVDWCNLERCKRVKPFRCGDAGLEDCIRRAEEQQARRRNGRRDQRVCATGGGGSGRYARKEDAVLQALDIERARLCLRSSSKPRTKPTMPSLPAPAVVAAGADGKPSLPAPAVVAAGADAQPSARPGTRKRRTPNDSEDDAPQRMKDLTDIGAPPKHATPNGLNRHLPTTSQMKRSKQSHHHHDSSANTKPITALDQQPCGVPRKRDRSRPLSELCNGDIWPPNNGLTPYPNGQRPGPELAAVGPVKTELDTKSCCTRRAGSSNGHKPNGHTADEHLMRAGSSLATKPCSRRAFVPVKTEPVDDYEPVVHAPLFATRSILKSDHLQAHQPCASTKAPTRECTKPASNCSKDGISSQRDIRNSKKKTTRSVDHDGGNRTKNVSEHERQHKAPSNRVVLLEKKVEKSTAVNKTAAPDDYRDLAVIPNGLGRVGAVLQRHSQIKCKVEEPAETISNHHPNLENVPVPSAVFKLPRQVLPPQHRDLAAVVRCHAAVKPVKTLQLNSSLYDVEVSAQGASSCSSSSSKGGRVPLVSLMSKSSRRPVVGYPVSVEVLEAPKPRPPAVPSVGYDGRPSTSNGASKRPVKVEMVEEEAAAPPRRAMLSSSSHKAGRAKAKSRRKASEDDEAWRPHTKNSDLAAATEAAPRKMRRLSSFAPSQRGGGGGRRPPSVVGEFCHRGPALACVPLRLVFSRIHEALSSSVK